mmetsp:Transcript_39470/g.99502  ORF Transcript_39470/g.99502 Transcript_39470/m.99502 type:complete len:281 (+) Transcript_39470:86-928(+)
MCMRGGRVLCTVRRCPLLCNMVCLPHGRGLAGVLGALLGMLGMVTNSGMGVGAGRVALRVRHVHVRCSVRCSVLWMGVPGLSGLAGVLGRVLAGVLLDQYAGGAPRLTPRRVPVRARLGTRRVCVLDALRWRHPRRGVLRVLLARLALRLACLFGLPLVDGCVLGKLFLLAGHGVFPEPVMVQRLAGSEPLLGVQCQQLVNKVQRLGRKLLELFRELLPELPLEGVLWLEHVPVLQLRHVRPVFLVWRTARAENQIQRFNLVVAREDGAAKNQFCNDATR